MKTSQYLATVAMPLIVWGSMTEVRGAAAIPDHYVVTVNGGVQASQVAAAHGLQPAFVYSKAVNGFAGFIPPGQLRKLAADPNVSSIVPDQRISVVAKGGKPVAPSPSQQVPLGVTRIGAAPGVAGYSGSGVGVAIVDTGLDFNHLDLPLGAQWYSSFDDSAQDAHGHGTHVGGTVAARNNSIDVVGVAPGATLYAVRVLDATGSGSDSSVIAGLDWIAENANIVTPPIRVANMSLGRPGNIDDSPAMRGAIQNLTTIGVTVVVAAGNDPNLEVSQQVPATYPEVIAVASTTAADGKMNRFKQRIPADTASFFTTDGAFDAATGIGVTISAPGEDQEDVNNAGFITSIGILSTRLGGGVTRMQGTSMASPHVAGVVALLYEKTAGTQFGPEDARLKIVAGASNPNAPLNSPVAAYTFDGDREGVVSAMGALAQ